MPLPVIPTVPVASGGTYDLGSILTLTAAGAGTYVSPDQPNTIGIGLIIVFDATAVGTTSVVITIQGKDAASGKYFTLLASAAVTTISTNVYTVYPGAAITANVSAASPIPDIWRVQVVATGGATALTATVGANVIGPTA